MSLSQPLQFPRITWAEFGELTETNQVWNHAACAVGRCDGSAKTVRNESTNECYANYTDEQVRDLFFHLLPQIPVQFTIRLAIHVTICALRVLTFKALWEEVKDGRPMNERFCALGIDALRVVAAPFVLIAALGIAMAGIVTPKGAMKAWRVLCKLEGFAEELQADPFVPQKHKFHHMDEEPVRLADFHPWTEWTEVQGHNLSQGVRRGKKIIYTETTTPQLIENNLTHKRYFNDDPWSIRSKGVGLIVGVPLIHSVALVQNIAERVIRIVTFSHFWIEVPEENGHYSLGGRVCSLGADVLRIALAPIALVGMELAVIYMVFNPLDGKKIYAAIEQLEYGSSNLPCMHPGFNPTQLLPLPCE